MKSTQKLFLFAITLAAFAFPTVAGATVIENVRPLIVTAGADPNDPMYTGNPGDAYDGVARLLISTSVGTFGCSASLIHETTLLTAAHCVDPSSFGAGATINGITAQFLNFSNTVFTALNWIFHPTWNGALFDGDDLGIIHLTGAVGGITPYTLYTGSGFGSTGDVAGYGRSGTGATGDTLPFGTFRHGQNEFDATLLSNGAFAAGNNNSGIFLYDFDNGTAACNSIGAVGQPSSTGLGNNEVMIAGGDSGGGSFIGGQLAGVHSFGANITQLDCAGGGLNSSFGEFGGDIRIAQEANLKFVRDNIPQQTVPEPGSLILLASGLAFSLIRRRRE